MRTVRRAASALPLVAVLLTVGGTAAVAADSTATPAPARVVTLRDARIAESSGLVVSPAHDKLVWTVNDSGSGPVVYGVSTRTGATRAVLRVRGVDFRDTESMAATKEADGRGLLWIGDIGDNERVRDSVVLRLVREPRRVTSTSVS